MRFTHIDVNFDVKYEGHQNCSKTLSMHIFRVFGHHHMWHQNWRQYVWTSLCQFIFFVNLLHSPCVWLFDIWHIFDNSTSFWQLDIFFDIWAIGNMGNGTHGQRSIMVNIKDRDGISWGMGHMGNGAHGQLGTWLWGPKFPFESFPELIMQLLWWAITIKLALLVKQLYKVDYD